MRLLKIFLFLMLVSCSFINAPACAAPTTTKITLVNHSGYPDTRVFLVAWGQVSGAPNYLNMLTGSLIPCTTADNTVTVYRSDGTTYPDKYCQYWTSLDQIKKADGTYSFSCPPIISARVYISFSKPVYLHVNDGPAMREPSTDNTDDPSYKTIWDKFEWTLDDAGLHANITPIDFVALPLQFVMKTSGGSVKGPMGFACPIGTVYNALNANPQLAPLKTQYRFFSPKAKNPTLSFPSDYLKPYVDYVWDNFWSEPGSLKITANGYPFTGQISGGVLTVTADGITPTETHTINRPESAEVFACDGAFAKDAGLQGLPFDRDGAIKNSICSALNRTVMHLPTSEWPNYTKYYQPNGLTSDHFRTNIYSRILHEVAIDHLIYGYPFDDQYDRASYITDPNGTELVLTINNSVRDSCSMVPSILLLDD